MLTRHLKVQFVTFTEIDWLQNRIQNTYVSSYMKSIKTNNFVLSVTNNYITFTLREGPL